MTGASTGASPLTSASRDSIRTSGRPPNRSRTIASATTDPAAAPTPCTTRLDADQLDGRARPTTARLATMWIEVATMQRQAPADRVAPRADEQLAEAEPDRRRGEGQLHETLGGVELAQRSGERRQVQVDRERAERGERSSTST